MESKELQEFDSLSKASHYVLWLDFKYRQQHLNFVVCKTKSGSYIVCEEEDAKGKDIEIIIPPGNLLETICYKDIEEMAKDNNPLYFWQEIRGFFSSTSSEVLMFLLDQNISLEQFICFELASRGYDKSGKWVGFNKAEQIWLE